MTANTPDEVESAASRSSRGGTTPSWPYLLVGLAVLCAGIAAWRPVPAGVWHDDGVYMLVAKAVAEGHGYTYTGVVGDPPAAKFPPVYPVVLATLWRIFGSIGAVTMAATLLNVGLLALGATLFAKALHETGGLSKNLASVVAGLGFVSTDLLRTAFVPLSEPLFMFFAALALVLWSRLDRPGPAPGVLALVAAVLAATVLTRSAGIAVVLAFTAALIVRGRWSVTAVATGPAWLAWAAWNRWSQAATASIPEGSRDLLGSYGSWLFDQTAAAPGAFLGGLPAHAAGLVGRAAAILVPGLTGPGLWVVAALAAPLAIQGCRLLIGRFPPLAWLTIGYLAMLLLWPYLDRRLLAPVHPMLLATIAFGALDLGARIGSVHLRRGLAGLAAGWVVAYSSVTAGRIADGWPTAPYRLRAERLAASVAALERTAPPDAIVGAPEFWAALHLHGGWTVAPSVRFDPRSVDPDAPIWGTPEEQITHWRSVGIDHLLLEQNGQLHGAALDRLEAACPGTVFVLARMPSSMVVRLEWDACA